VYLVKITASQKLKLPSLLLTDQQGRVRTGRSNWAIFPGHPGTDVMILKIFSPKKLAFYKHF
jgi:hypothetical protein